MTFCFALLLINPLLKRVNSKRKEFAPKRSKFFPFREESLLLFLKEVPPLQAYPFLLSYCCCWSPVENACKDTRMTMPNNVLQHALLICCALQHYSQYMLKAAPKPEIKSCPGMIFFCLFFYILALMSVFSHSLFLWGTTQNDLQGLTCY